MPLAVSSDKARPAVNADQPTHLCASGTSLCFKLFHFATHPREHTLTRSRPVTILRLPHSCLVQWGGTLVPASELPITQLCNPSCCLCDSFAFLTVNAVSIPPAPSVVFARVGGSFAVASSIMPRRRTRRMHGGNSLWHSIDCGCGGCGCGCGLRLPKRT